MGDVRDLLNTVAVELEARASDDERSIPGDGDGPSTLREWARQLRSLAARGAVPEGWVIERDGRGCISIKPSLPGYDSACGVDPWSDDPHEKILYHLAGAMLAAAAPQPAGEAEKVGAFGQRFIDGMGWAVPCSRAAAYVADMRKAALEMAEKEFGHYVGAGSHGIADEPAPSAPADLPADLAATIADDDAAWRLARLAVECGAEDNATDGQPQTWTLGVAAFTELARRLSAQQAAKDGAA